MGLFKETEPYEPYSLETKPNPKGKKSDRVAKAMLGGGMDGGNEGGGGGKGGSQGKEVAGGKTANELGLGGKASFMGKRDAASKDLTGDQMMEYTLKDKSYGYYNPQTREYVPWYIDIKDGGGMNQAGDTFKGNNFISDRIAGRSNMLQKLTGGAVSPYGSQNEREFSPSPKERYMGGDYQQYMPNAYGQPAQAKPSKVNGGDPVDWGGGFGPDPVDWGNGFGPDPVNWGGGFNPPQSQTIGEIPQSLLQDQLALASEADQILLQYGYKPENLKNISASQKEFLIKMARKGKQ